MLGLQLVGNALESRVKQQRLVRGQVAPQRIKLRTEADDLMNTVHVRAVRCTQTHKRNQ